VGFQARVWSARRFATQHAPKFTGANPGGDAGEGVIRQIQRCIEQTLIFDFRLDSHSALSPRYSSTLHYKIS
jgi:hypothetical protein